VTVRRARRIESQTERMMAIIDHLRAFARTTTDAQVVVSLNDLIHSALLLCEQHLRERGVVLVVDLVEPPPLARGEASDLEQVVLHLLTNARDALTLSGRHIWVRTGHGEASVWLAVRDDGPGIEATILDRIFEPFFTTKEVGYGTGLGLAVVRTVVERHGGSVTVRTTPGEGATFTVTLPAALDDGGDVGPVV
jgi:signal transduction histidine kinase